MALLLDTHALLWWLAGDDRLTAAARAAVEDGDTRVFVSAASAWEIATKVRLGTVPGAARVAAAPLAICEAEGFTPLPVELDHAAAAGGLPGELRDPVDRLLIAQALTEDLTLVSDDASFERYGIKRLW